MPIPSQFGPIRIGILVLGDLLVLEQFRGLVLDGLVLVLLRPWS